MRKFIFIFNFMCFRFIVLLALPFLLAACEQNVPAPDRDAPPPLPSEVHKLSVNSEGRASVTLNELKNSTIFLVKVNTSNNEINANIVPSDFVSGKNIRTQAGTVTIGGKTLDRYELHWQIELTSLVPAGSANRNMVNSATTTYKIGDTNDFFVDASKEKKTAKATLKQTGAHCDIWVANDSFDTISVKSPNDGKVNQEQIDQLADKFDEIYPLETNLLGYEKGGGPNGDGGADGNEKIQILVYDIYGDYGKYKTGVVYGYFYPGDEFSLDKDNDLYSNEAEIFYLDSEILDEYPAGIYSTLIHEFNHMINYNIKVFNNNLLNNMAIWYTEMLSMLAEDVIGPLVEIKYIPAVSNGNVIVERINSSWLSGYSSAGVMQWPTDPNEALPYYASNYAFGAYIMRNFGGPELLSAIAKSEKSDRDSLDYFLREFNGPYVDSGYAMSRFGEALVYSGSNIPSGAFSFDKRAEHGINGVNYVFYPFDIWQISNSHGDRTGPRIYPYDKQSDPILDRTLKVFSRNEWQNKSGSFTVEIEHGNPAVEYYVMVK